MLRNTGMTSIKPMKMASSRIGTGYSLNFLSWHLTGTQAKIEILCMDLVTQKNPTIKGWEAVEMAIALWNPGQRVS